MSATYNSIAQNVAISDVHISGGVTDRAGQLVEFIKVSLFSVDSTLLSKTWTDTTSRFSFSNVKPGKYRLLFSGYGYDTKSLDLQVDRNTELGNITMDTLKFELDAVVVRGSYVKRRTDGYSVSLKNRTIVEGKTANELLSILPGMSKTMDNEISLNGSSLSKVYINGREVKNLKELETLQADQISNIDVNYRPGSQYDAQVRGGVINIKLNALQDGGYSGSVSGSASVRPKYGFSSDHVSGMFNYRYKKFSLYNYASYFDFRNISEYDIYSSYPETGTLVDMNTSTDGWDHGLYDNLALQYEFNSKHSLATSLILGWDNGMPYERSYSTNSTKDGVYLNSSNSDISRHNTNLKYQGVMSYIWSIDSKGSQLKVDADYMKNNAANNSDYLFEYWNTDIKRRSDVKRSDLSGITDMFETTADLNLKLGENSTLMTGLRYYYRDIDRKLDYQEFENGAWLINDKMSDNFTVGGQGYAAFADFSSTIGRFSYNVALRYQYDQLSHDSRSQHIAVNKNFSNFFPTLGVGYAIEQQNIFLNLSYSRSIGYIPYSEISPAVQYESEYAYTKGNPDLTMSIDNCLSFMFSVKNWNLWYNYYHMMGDIEYFTYIDSTNPLVKYTMPQNTGSSDWHLAGVDVYFDPFKWWRLKLSASIKHKNISYHEGEIDRSYANTLFSGGIQNNFTFKEKWGGFLNFYGETKDIFDGKTMLPVWNISIGAYVYFCDKRLRLRVESQPLVSKLRQSIVNQQYLYSKSVYKTSQQAFTFTLTYNFKRGTSVGEKRIEQLQYLETRTEVK